MSYDEYSPAQLFEDALGKTLDKFVGIWAFLNDFQQNTLDVSTQATIARWLNRRSTCGFCMTYNKGIRYYSCGDCPIFHYFKTNCNDIPYMQNLLQSLGGAVPIPKDRVMDRIKIIIEFLTNFRNLTCQ